MPYQLYVRYSGAAYQLLVPAASPSGGVTSFAARTGAVVPAANDYSFSQLASPSTTLSCTTAQLSSGSSGTLTASGCTIK